MSLILFLHYITSTQMMSQKIINSNRDFYGNNIQYHNRQQQQQIQQQQLIFLHCQQEQMMARQQQHHHQEHCEGTYIYGLTFNVYLSFGICYR